MLLLAVVLATIAVTVIVRMGNESDRTRDSSIEACYDAVELARIRVGVSVSDPEFRAIYERQRAECRTNAGR